MNRRPTRAQSQKDQQPIWAMAGYHDQPIWAAAGYGDATDPTLDPSTPTVVPQTVPAPSTLPVAAPVAPPPAAPVPFLQTIPSWLVILDTASMAASAYHGYKRNNSIGWALWWGLMGAAFPVITPTIALAQGFGAPEK